MGRRAKEVENKALNTMVEGTQKGSKVFRADIKRISSGHQADIKAGDGTVHVGNICCVG